MTSVDGKVAFITGGASGVGRGMAEALAAAGARVAIADICDATRIDAVAGLKATGADCIGVALDVTDAASWTAAVDLVESDFGAIDLLCNNAGVGQGYKTDGQPVLLEEMSEDLFRLVLDINIVGVFLGVRAVVPGMIARAAGGHVVNTASMAGLIAPPGLGAYAASKFAVMGLSESLRGELAPHGIGVSILCPGGVQSNLVDSSAERRAATMGADADAAAGLVSSRPRNPEMMEAISVGRRVLSAIIDDEFFILTHPEYRPLIQERFDGVLRAAGAPAQAGYRDPDWLLNVSRNPAYTA